MVRPPRLPSLAFVNGGASFTSRQVLAVRAGGGVPPIAHCAKASPSVRASFATSSW